jgi:formyltetrahydrofolate deformylase
MNNFVFTLTCQDQPGIVRAASSAIVSLDGNILENDQFTDPVTNTFVMRTRFETPRGELDAIRATLETDLGTFSPHIGLRREESLRRAVVLVSKFDHCLADLFYRREQGDLPLEITAVVSNHEDLRPLCERYGVDFHYVPVTSSSKAAAEATLATIVRDTAADFIVLARYMQILSPSFCASFAGRIINIHHSFLPGFKGAKPYHQAYERGVKLIGATAHFVTSDLDEGPIIEQDVTRVTHARRASDLVSLGRDIERSVLSRAVRLLAEDRVSLVGQRTVVFTQ